MSKRRGAPVDRVLVASAPPIDRAATIAVAVLLVLSIALVAYVRLRLADTPLERDEGEYAYAGQLIRDGTPPYSLVYNMKFPGVYYSYAVIMSVCGESPRGIRIGLLCVNIATALLLFGLVHRMAGLLASGVAASAFLLLSLDTFAMGPFAHATHFVTLPVVAGLFVLWPAFERPRTWRFITCGLLMGLAVAMKQQAFPFVLLAIGLAAWPASGGRRTDWRAAMWRGALVAIGSAAVLGGLVGLLAVAGVFDRFWFWTFQYAAAYASLTSLREAGSVFVMAWEYVTRASAVLWYASAAGVLLAAFAPVTWRVRCALWFWLLAAAAAIAPGFYFRPHYFIVAMPVAACFIAVGISAIDQSVTRFTGARAARFIGVTVFLAVAGVYLWVQAPYFFRMTPHSIVRLVYEANPFEESPEIGRFIRDRSRPGDRIAVLGSEPQIYFYADRPAATGYIYTYPLMEPHPYAAEMQAEMRREIEAARPSFIVFVASPLSWLVRPNSDTSILTWANEYASRCYARVGLVDIPPQGLATFAWDEESLRYTPRFASQVYVLRRVVTPDCTPPAR